MPTKSAPMTNAKALRLIRKNDPKTPKECRQLGIGLTFVDAGVFREVYRVKGAGLIIKFPINDGTSPCNIQHSISEMRRIKRLNKIVELRPHLPKVFYFNKDSGVIVMRYYPELAPDDMVELLGAVVKKLVSRVARVSMSDIHDGNIRKKHKDQHRLVFVDLGF